MNRNTGERKMYSERTKWNCGGGICWKNGIACVVKNNMQCEDRKLQIKTTWNICILCKSTRESNTSLNWITQWYAFAFTSCHFQIRHSHKNKTFSFGFWFMEYFYSHIRKWFALCMTLNFIWYFTIIIVVDWRDMNGVVIYWMIVTSCVVCYLFSQCFSFVEHPHANAHKRAVSVNEQEIATIALIAMLYAQAIIFSLLRKKHSSSACEEKMSTWAMYRCGGEQIDQ